MKQLWAPWRLAYVESAGTDSGECFICAAAEDETGLTVHRDDGIVVLLNRFPYSSGHLLIAPRRHAPGLLALDGPESAAVTEGIRLGMRAVGEAMSPDGFNVGLNQGAAGGASVEHVHAHVVPRWSGDTNFMPVLADVKVLPEHLEATAARLRPIFAAMTQSR